MKIYTLFLKNNPKYPNILNKIHNYLPTASMIIMLIGLVIFLFVNNVYGFYTFSFGAAVLALVRFLDMIHEQGKNKANRLPQIRVLSALSLLGAAYMMYDGSNSWSVLLLVTAVLEVYVSFRQK